MAAAAVALTLAAPAGATTPGWADEGALEITIEDHGLPLVGGRRAVDSGICFGVRRFGHRVVGYVHQYHRFNCTLDGADGREYRVAVAVTQSRVAAKPLAGRDEPAYLASDLEAARDTLAAKERSVAMRPGTVLTAAQKAGLAKFLGPYQRAVVDAEAALEPYRTVFSWRVV